MTRLIILLCLIAVSLFFYSIYKQYKEGNELVKLRLKYKVNTVQDIDSLIEEFKGKVRTAHTLAERYPSIYRSQLEKAEKDLKKIEKLKQIIESETI